jgi:sec-independent protein translocase protein TatC
MTTTREPDSGVDETQYSSGEMSLIEHLAELRTRLIRAGIGIVVGMVLSVLVLDRVFQALIRLAEPHTLIATAPPERFAAYIKVSFTIGMAFAMPLIVYQLFAFVSPGLTRRERGYVLRAMPFVALLFFGGLAFGWFVVVPSAMRFLYNFGSAEIESLPKVSEFISFTTNLLIWIGVSFELPVIVYTVIKLGIVSADKLASYRRYVFLGIVVAAAIITPTPDPLNMMLVAGPMYLLFEMGIILGRFGTRDRADERRSP